MTTDGRHRSPADLVIEVFEADLRAHPHTHAELRRTGASEVDLDAFFLTSERGRGHASRALRRLLDLADEHGVTVTLTAMPLHVRPDGGGPALKPDLDLEALLAWYGRHGFETDGEEYGCPTMRRPPDAPTPSP